MSDEINACKKCGIHIFSAMSHFCRNTDKKINLLLSHGYQFIQELFVYKKGENEISCEFVDDHHYDQLISLFEEKKDLI